MVSSMPEAHIFTSIHLSDGPRASDPCLSDMSPPPTAIPGAFIPGSFVTVPCASSTSASSTSDRRTLLLSMLMPASATRPRGMEPESPRAPASSHVLLRHRPPSIRSWRLLGLVLLAGGGQRLVSRPVLNAALELVHRRRCCPTGMPNDPYDLANASALTAIGRRPAGGSQALAVSTAALADHVCDSWHRRQIRFSRRQ